jgi:Kinesin motor domain
VLVWCHNRHVGETAMNRESSRSHAVFTLVIEATEEVKAEGLTRCRVARYEHDCSVLLN